MVGHRPHHERRVDFRARMVLRQGDRRLPENFPSRGPTCVSPIRIAAPALGILGSNSEQPAPRIGDASYDSPASQSSWIVSIASCKSRSLPSIVFNFSIRGPVASSRSLSAFS